MAHNGELTVNPKPEDFLIKEYEGLLELNKAREERFDKLVTLFLSLAGAPWALYVLAIKDHPNFDFGAMPLPIGWVFLLVGLLGFVVVIMCVQTKFLITLYMRSINAIRGHFEQPTIKDALRLPTSGSVPPYFETGSYNFFAAMAMAIVNGFYVWLALDRMIPALLYPVPGYVWIALYAGIAWAIAHFGYYVHQAQNRETNDRGRLKFGDSSKAAPQPVPPEKKEGA